MSTLLTRDAETVPGEFVQRVNRFVIRVGFGDTIPDVPSRPGETQGHPRFGLRSLVRSGSATGGSALALPSRTTSAEAGVDVRAIATAFDPPTYDRRRAGLTVTLD